MDEVKINRFIKIYRDGLLEDTVPFWTKYAPDFVNGGYYNYLDRDGSVLNRDKSVWIQGRLAWLLSTLYNEVEEKEEWLMLAKHGIDFLKKYCFDTDGRLFYEVTEKGEPLRKRRYVCSEVFALMAFSEYGKAAKDQECVDIAKEIYMLYLRHYFNPDLLQPKVFPQTRQTKSHPMRMSLLNLSQQIRRNGEDPLYDEIIDKAINEINQDFVHDNERAFFEVVGLNGERLDSPEGRCVNPGHAIESSWFMLEEAKRRGDHALAMRSCQLIEWSLELGWDKNHGGITYFIDIEGKPCLQYEYSLKLAWPHSEALYATLLAYSMTDDHKFEKWHDTILEWSLKYFPDHEYGDWFKYLNRDGSVSHRIKGNNWVGPFHLPRAQLLCWKLLKEMKP